MSNVSRLTLRRATLAWRGISFALAVLAVLGGSAARGREPTIQEQFMLEMINRMRTHPQQELDLLANINYGAAISFATPSSDDPNVAAALDFFHVRPDLLVSQWSALVPVQPVAWNAQLGDSSSTYSQVMIDVDAQGHNLDEHKNAMGQADLAARLIASDYLFVGGGTAGENVFAFARSESHAHAAFAIDWGTSASGIQNPPGHRELIMNGDMREIGIGILADSDSATSVGPLAITQHFAVDYASDAFLTGVAFADASGDAFYTPGEGLGGVAIVAVDAASGARFATTTWAAGGYSLELPPGEYDVVASGPGVGQLNFPGIVVNSSNVKLDIVPTSPPMLGDANMDGTVDRRDAVRLMRHFGVGTEALWGDGDFDFDGAVTLADLAILGEHLAPADVVPNVAAVPEPSAAWHVSGLLAAIGIFSVARRRASHHMARSVS